MKKATRPALVLLAIFAGVIGGAGCFRAPSSYTQSPSSGTVIDVPPNKRGAEASSGGAQATVTPALETRLLVEVLPANDVLKGFSASIAREEKNPVPMPDGTRTEFTTVSKSFTKTEGSRSLAIQASLTDTRSIPVLTAFIDSYSEYSNNGSKRKKIFIKDQPAWLTYQVTSGDVSEGFGSLVMLYRNRFLLQLNGNLGVTEEQLADVLKGYRFEMLQ